MTNNDFMRAVVLTGHGNLDKLEFHGNWRKPTPAANEVLIKVAACGLNNTDINVRTGWYSQTGAAPTTGVAKEDTADDASWGSGGIAFPRIQGADVVGVVESVGEAVGDKSLVGKRVLVDTWLRDWNDPHNVEKVGYFGSECDGGYADYTTVPWQQAHPVDSTLSDAELATFATSYVTAENMLNRAAVNENDTVLITGASGGVGSALAQLCKRRGARTVAVCGEEKAAAVRDAVHPAALLPRHTRDFKKALQDAIGDDTVSVVADVVGGDSWHALIDALAHGGRYTCAGAIAGPIVEFDLRTFYLRDLTLTGATVVPPSVFSNLVGYIERGEIRPLLAATHPLENLREAQQQFMDKRHFGNIVVTMN